MADKDAGHRDPAAEMARLWGLLEDGTKGMAILNGEILRLRAELAALDYELTATPRGLTVMEALLDERRWIEREDGLKAERDAARADAEKAWVLATRAYAMLGATSYRPHRRSGLPITSRPSARRRRRDVEKIAAAQAGLGG